MFQPTKSVGENTPKSLEKDKAMVTNAELTKKVDEKEQDNKLLRERLSQMEQLLGEVPDKAKKMKDKIDKKEEE